MIFYMYISRNLKWCQPFSSGETTNSLRRIVKCCTMQNADFKCMRSAKSNFWICYDISVITAYIASICLTSISPHYSLAKVMGCNFQYIYFWMAIFCKLYIQMHLQQCKLSYFDSSFIGACFWGSNTQCISFVSDNGLTSNRSHAIT